MYRVIRQVEKNSIAQRKGIRAGEELLSINGEPVLDYIDYAFFMGERDITLRILDKNGAERGVRIRKQEGGDIGLLFAEEQVGAPARCRNKCVFCFIDQLPPGMRDTLQVKDDDWRHSFLMGNYVTLTNLEEADMARIIRRKVSPLYVSVHATDEDLRRRMLGVAKAPALLPQLQRLAQAGVTVHAQVVACPGLNDGEQLVKTISDLYALYPGVASVAVVPVGLTKYRENLPLIRPVSKADAAAMLEAVHRLQKQYLEESGTRFVFAADELYLRAEHALPEYGAYGDFAQIENGVGLVAQFCDGLEAGMEDFDRTAYTEVSVATGCDFAPLLKQIANGLQSRYNIHVHVYGVRNVFFGETVTVAGLLTGADVAAQLQGKALGQKLFLPGCMFREFTDVTLDGMTAGEIGQALGVPVEIVPPDGYEWMEALAKE